MLSIEEMDEINGSLRTTKVESLCLFICDEAWLAMEGTLYPQQECGLRAKCLRKDTSGLFPRRRYGWSFPQISRCFPRQRQTLGVAGSADFHEMLVISRLQA